MNLEQIIAKQNSGTPLTAEETAFLINNDLPAMAAFMLANNPGSVNLTLRQMGYNHLGFEPNIEALKAQMALLIDMRKADELEQVIKNFTVRAETITPDLAAALKAYNTQ